MLIKMSSKKGRARLSVLAEPVVGKKIPCIFCQRHVDDEVAFGKSYSIGDIQCHYFCVLLSCCLVQKGKDEEGLFGFLYPDILAEVERSKKHKCSYCSRGGATLGCSISQCRKQFHLPCGRERGSVSLFYGNYRSYCQQHAPKQKIPDKIMDKAKLRLTEDRRKSKKAKTGSEKLSNSDRGASDDYRIGECVCVICYEPVKGYPTRDTFWPPCCARDAWFHRSCLERMALSAGMHYLKCPLCNDKDRFYQSVVDQGYYVPDRDAAWELEQNAFAEIYERPASCGAVECKCSSGRDHDSQSGMWDLKLCILCGSSAIHAHCLESIEPTTKRFVCSTCQPAAPQDLESLATSIEAVIIQEQSQNNSVIRVGPIMPSRMSLRRTKQRSRLQVPSTSAQNIVSKTENREVTSIESSRLELNLKAPKRKLDGNRNTPNVENVLMSPLKLLEKEVQVKMSSIPTDVVLAKLGKLNPTPLSVKRKLVNNLVEELFDSLFSEHKSKEPVKEWCSPKKISSGLEVYNYTGANTNKEQENCEIPLKKIKLTDAFNPKKVSNSQHNDEDLIVKSIENQTESCGTEIILSEDNLVKHNEGSIVREDDESSRSTFQLPAEFIADNSNDSVPYLDSNNKLRTVDIKKDSSLEISACDETVNIDVFQVESGDFQKIDLTPVKSDKCALKFSLTDKEVLQRSNVDMDLESFKNQYLNEVGGEFVCSFKHKHTQETRCLKFQSVIDFAVKAAIDKRSNSKKKSKSKKGRKKKKPSDKQGNKTTKIPAKKPKTRIKKATRIKYRIKFNERAKNKEKLRPKVLKQYVLKYSTANTDALLVTPSHSVERIKKRKKKTGSSPDHLVQTSITSFFKTRDEK